MELCTWNLYQFYFNRLRNQNKEDAVSTCLQPTYTVRVWKANFPILSDLIQIFTIEKKNRLFAWKLSINSALLLTISWIYTIFTISIQNENFGWDFFLSFRVHTILFEEKDIINLHLFAFVRKYLIFPCVHTFLFFSEANAIIE